MSKRSEKGYQLYKSLGKERTYTKVAELMGLSIKTVETWGYKEKWQEKIKVILTVDNGDEDYEGNIGLVTKYIPDLDIIDKSNVAVIIVGPPMMMKFSLIEFQKLAIKDEDMWVSYERKMSCGLGKCGHCRMDKTYICTDGPVFNYSFAKTLDRIPV